MTIPSDMRPVADQAPVPAAEQRFRALVSVSTDTVYKLSPDWHYRWLLGGDGLLLNDPLADTDWLSRDVYHGDYESVKAIIDAGVRSKRMFQMEYRTLKADGSIAWTFMRAAPVPDDNGGIMEWLCSCRDITPRKLQQDGLLEARDKSEQQKRLYETITASTPDLIYVFDLNYRFTYANEALLAMWGKTWDQAIGRNLLENGYEPWHAEMHEREIDQVKTTKKGIRGEVSFPHATLGRRIYDYIFTPVINGMGEVEAVAGTTRDITDIRNAETAIKESEARFRTMAGSTDVMITVGDETGNATYFNEAWTRLTGRQEEELLRYGWVDIVHPDDKQRVMQIFDAAFQEKKNWQWEFRIRDNQGLYRWLLMRGMPRFWSDGSFAGYTSSSIDITELKENEQRKNDFISMVSHELKTPLTSAISYVQVSQRKVLADGNTLTAGMLERADRQLRKMTGMINGFLDVSRLESGKIHMNRQPFDLTLLLKEIEEEASITSSLHEVAIEAPMENWVEADREKIGQVVGNLISNAVKYSPAGTKIEVVARQADGEVQVSISDEGIGISPEDLPRLFERFYRVRGNENSQIAGFGIGLYLCKEIITGHGGKIWAESTPGKGSVFHFSLPLVYSYSLVESARTNS